MTAVAWEIFFSNGVAGGLVKGVDHGVEVVGPGLCGIPAVAVGHLVKSRHDGSHLLNPGLIHLPCNHGVGRVARFLVFQGGTKPPDNTLIFEPGDDGQDIGPLRCQWPGPGPRKGVDTQECSLEGRPQLFFSMSVNMGFIMYFTLSLSSTKFCRVLFICVCCCAMQTKMLLCRPMVGRFLVTDRWSQFGS